MQGEPLDVPVATCKPSKLHSGKQAGPFLLKKEALLGALALTSKIQLQGFDLLEIDAFLLGQLAGVVLRSLLLHRFLQHLLIDHVGLNAVVEATHVREAAGPRLTGFRRWP